ncbi:MAG: hypothetical protein NC408_05915 [Candidatus Gastranaerophilales bacterium]|nr:hypothetical protein [Candidatus Gastranaerophilales bacterium]MCM1072408.1 hypothetical protein [Bacteroides sp.]
MKINQINNTNFKQTFMPNYNRYTDIQKEIGDDIAAKMDVYEKNQDRNNKEVANETYRPDILVARLGNKDSLHVFSCLKNFDYNTMRDLYMNKLYVGKYDKEHPFNPEDIEKAKKHSNLNSFKATALTFLAAVTAALGLTAKRTHRI